MSFTKKQDMFRSAAITWAAENNKNLSVVTKSDLTEIATSVGMSFPHWITRVPTYKVDKGTWFVPVDGDGSSTIKVRKSPSVEAAA